MSKFDYELQVEDRYDDLEYAEFQALLREESIAHYEEEDFAGIDTANS